MSVKNRLAKLERKLPPILDDGETLVITIGESDPKNPCEPIIVKCAWSVGARK